MSPLLRLPLDVFAANRFGFMPNSSPEIDGLKIILGAQSCLIVDPSKTSAANFRAALRQFGMASGSIFTASTVAEAEVLMNEKKPTILIADFNQRSPETFQLVEKFEKVHPEKSRVTLLMISADEPAVFSDGQIDGHLLKPYNLDSLRRTLLKSMIVKFYPDAYKKKVLQADEFAAAGLDEAAQMEYEAARTLNPNPLRVHRGLAFLHQKSGRFDQALAEFRKAREISSLDYKTVVGEFEILLTVGDLQGAIALVPLLRDSLPTDAFRLQKLFETVTYAQKFDELMPLFKTFKDLPERTEALVEAVQASFFFAGKSAMATVEKVSALEFFDVGYVVSARRFDYVEKVVREFLKKGLRAEAELFLAKSMPEDVGSSAYQRVCFELDCLILPADALLDRGRKLVFEGHGTPEIFEKMVSMFAEAGKVTHAESIIAKATESFPSLRDSLYAVLNSSVPARDNFQKAA